MRNYNVLTEYCTKKAANDPIAKYCHRRVTDSKYRVAWRYVGRVSSAVCEFTVKQAWMGIALQEQEFKSYILNISENTFIGADVSELSQRENTVNTADIIMFVRKVCEHLDARFPENELKEWAVFDVDILDATSDFDHG